MIQRRKTGIFWTGCLGLLWIGSVWGCAGPFVHEGVHNCQTPQQSIQAGIYDVLEAKSGEQRPYMLRMGIRNYSGVDISNIKATVWFEYPPNFSLTSLGSSLHTKDNPQHLEVEQAIVKGKPDTIHSIVIEAIPVELAKIWVRAPELKVFSMVNNISFYQSGTRFLVEMHLQITGFTKEGHQQFLIPLIFPVAVCKGCLQRSNNQPPSSFCIHPDLQDPTFSKCGLQDGFCSPSPTTRKAP